MSLDWSSWDSLDMTAQMIFSKQNWEDSGIICQIIKMLLLEVQKKIGDTELVGHSPKTPKDPSQIHGLWPTQFAKLHEVKPFYAIWEFGTASGFSRSTETIWDGEGSDGGGISQDTGSVPSLTVSSQWDMERHTWSSLCFNFPPYKVPIILPFSWGVVTQNPIMMLWWVCYLCVPR